MSTDNTVCPWQSTATNNKNAPKQLPVVAGSIVNVMQSDTGQWIPDFPTRKSDVFLVGFDDLELRLLKAVAVTLRSASDASQPDYSTLAEVDAAVPTLRADTDVLDAELRQAGCYPRLFALPLPLDDALQYAGSRYVVLVRDVLCAFESDWAEHETAAGHSVAPDDYFENEYVSGRGMRRWHQAAGWTQAASRQPQRIRLLHEGALLEDINTEVRGLRAWLDLSAEAETDVNTDIKRLFDVGQLTGSSGQQPVPDDLAHVIRTLAQQVAELTC